MKKLAMIVAVAFSLNATEMPQCNKCYDEIFDSAKGVNILKNGREYYDATLISLGFSYGFCGAKELRGETIDCNALHSTFNEFRSSLVWQAQNRDTK